MMGQGRNFARVVVPSPVKHPLIYQVPTDLRSQLDVGMRVLIPLGKRKVTGLVLELLAETSLTRTKEILATYDEPPILDTGLLQLAQWLSQYYLTNLGEVLATILPRGLKIESQRSVVAKPGIYTVSGAAENKILDHLRHKNGPTTVKSLTRKFSGANLYRALEQLETAGAIEIRELLPGQQKKAHRPPPEPGPASSPIAPAFALTAEQEKALARIDDRLQKGGFETFLLHGVTASGKTEIYLRSMERVREAGRRSLILIPEISLTPQLMDRLNCRFPGRIGVLHSALSGAERWAQWWQILRGKVDVVVGARSAIFAPLPDLGLVVVDEEHDPSYKQEDGLRYNGRDVAVVRGKLSGCVVILGSATPSIESYQNCLQGRYQLLEMKQRVYDRPMPAIDTVDLRVEFKNLRENLRPRQDTPPTGAAHARKNLEQRWISERFAESLRNNYRQSRQSLIFLNRRGFSNFLLCGLCGYVLRCSRCSVTLTLHLKQNWVCCHHCNFRRPATTLCPGCGNPSLTGVGVGTEGIEQALRALVPGARIARMDRDTTSKRGSHEGLIRRWEKGEIDILVGTQMVTKGHDVTGVTLVGALLADLSLNVPDFRAAERTFQLLSQVAGRSGRGNDPGRVIIQTYTPDHYAIQHLANHDYQGFFRSEIGFRRALNYPPFSRLVNLRFDGPKRDEVEAKARSLAAALRDRQRGTPQLRDEVEILGPAPAPIEKLRNRYRWQILLKGNKISTLQELVGYSRDLLPRSRSVRLHVDVDPYNML